MVNVEEKIGEFTSIASSGQGADIPTEWHMKELVKLVSTWREVEKQAVFVELAKDFDGGEGWTPSWRRFAEQLLVAPSQFQIVHGYYLCPRCSALCQGLHLGDSAADPGVTLCVNGHAMVSGQGIVETFRKG